MTSDTWDFLLRGVMHVFRHRHTITSHLIGNDDITTLLPIPATLQAI